MIPMNKFAEEQQNASVGHGIFIPAGEVSTPLENGVKVKPMKCYNDFVAILQQQVDAQLLLGNVAFKNEGIVVGVGPGMPNATGRTGSQLAVGDYVAFYGNPLTVIEPNAGVYAGKRIIIISEKFVICQLPSIPYELVD